MKGVSAAEDLVCLEPTPMRIWQNPQLPTLMHPNQTGNVFGVMKLTFLCHNVHYPFSHPDRISPGKNQFPIVQSLQPTDFSGSILL
jgi:hypothetical protein